jgi:hypothetical protein
MGIQIQGASGTIVEVGGTTFKAAHVHPKPLEYGALGHYRASVRISSASAQAALSRLLTLRNTGTNLIIPTRMTLRAVQVTAGTAQENSIDVYKATSFTVTDTTNVASVTPSVKRTSSMASSSGGQLRTVTQTGVAAGSTGGTLTLDSVPLATFPYMVSTTAATSNTGTWGPYDAFDDVNGTHPIVLAQNEGIVLVNRVLNVTSYGIVWYLDICWAEVTAY